MKRATLLFAITLICCTAQVSSGQTIEPLALWDLYTQSTMGPSPWEVTNYNDNLIVGPLTRGNGLTASGRSYTNSWGAAGYNDGLDLSSQDINTAIANENFITFSITPQPGSKVSFFEIAPYNIRRDNNGPRIFQWQYSIDGTVFNNVGIEEVANNTSSNGNPQAAVNLTVVEQLQEVPAGTTVTFRVVAWYATGDEGLWGFCNTVSKATNVVVNGIVSAVDLPLQLLSFNGKQEKGVNRLNWETAQEKDIIGFEVERGIDGQHFTTIAKLNATGNGTLAPNSYTYDDQSAGEVAYYRLKTVGIDGYSNYSHTVILRKDAAKKGTVRLYPNPSGSVLLLEGLKGKASYNITDATGKNVLSAQTINAADGALIQIDIAKLSNGIYFLHYTDAGSKETLQFVKE